ncbi:hypothetical protein AAMO2058_001407900 [Amorphochlora amoebiformis]
MVASMLTEEKKRVIEMAYKMVPTAKKKSPWKWIKDNYLKGDDGLTNKVIRDYGNKWLKQGAGSQTPPPPAIPPPAIPAPMPPQPQMQYMAPQRQYQAHAIASESDDDDYDDAPPRRNRPRKKRKCEESESDIEVVNDADAEDEKSLERRAMSAKLKRIAALIGKGPPPIFYDATEYGNKPGMGVAIAKHFSAVTSVNVHSEIRCVHISILYRTVGLTDLEQMAGKYGEKPLAKALNYVRNFKNPDKVMFEYAFTIPEGFVMETYDLFAQSDQKFIILFFQQLEQKRGNNHKCGDGEFGQLSCEKTKDSANLYSGCLD